MAIAAERVRRTFLPDIPTPAFTGVTLVPRCQPHSEVRRSLTHPTLSFMSPFSTVLSRLWTSLARNFHKAKAVSDTPTSPGPLPLPHKTLEEPQYAADFCYADDQAHSFPSSFSFSDPSSSFGLLRWPLTSLRRDLTSVPVETENPSTVSYEEVLVTGQNRFAAYEEWCRVTNVSMI